MLLDMTLSLRQVMCHANAWLLTLSLASLAAGTTRRV